MYNKICFARARHGKLMRLLRHAAEGRWERASTCYFLIFARMLRTLCCLLLRCIFVYQRIFCTFQFLHALQPLAIIKNVITIETYCSRFNNAQIIIATLRLLPQLPTNTHTNSYILIENLFFFFIWLLQCACGCKFRAHYE